MKWDLRENFMKINNIKGFLHNLDELNRSGNQDLILMYLIQKVRIG